ncbi:MAG: hypothetical protein PHU25_06785 [Deltaproteobacteria bacterium]|nr:hypothetical protein [Deltaproteobacteria bacterium]
MTDTAPGDAMRSVASMRLEIAGLAIDVEVDRPTADIGFDPAHRRFLAPASGVAAPDLVLRCTFGALPIDLIGNGELVFDSGGLWTLRRVDGRLVFVLRAPERRNAPYRVAILDEDLSQGQIASTTGGRMDAPSALLPDPLEYPLGEAILVCLLARGFGLMIHGCGVDDGGRGYLFAGQSGHGKTTMARLWQGEARVLNDDRIVLRARDERLVMYGTPWHGDHPEVDSGGVPLERIFLLSHAPSNGMVAVRPSDAASRLLARSFPPLWSAQGMSRTLEFLAEVTSLAPCASLGFAPTKDVVGFVRDSGRARPACGPRWSGSARGFPTAR